MARPARSAAGPLGPPGAYRLHHRPPRVPRARPRRRAGAHRAPAGAPARRAARRWSTAGHRGARRGGRTGAPARDPAPAHARGPRSIERAGGAARSSPTPTRARSRSWRRRRCGCGACWAASARRATPLWRRGGRLAYVSDCGHGELAVVDLSPGASCGASRSATARATCRCTRGRTLWVSLGSSAAEIAVLDVRDPLRPRPVRRVAAAVPRPRRGFSPSGHRVG